MLTGFSIEDEAEDGDKLVTSELEPSSESVLEKSDGLKDLDGEAVDVIPMVRTCPDVNEVVSNAILRLQILYSKYISY